MIQRMQSVFLLLGILFLILFLFSPIFNIEPQGEIGIEKAWENKLYSSLSLLIVGGMAIIIFLFKSRPLQIKIAGLIALINLILCIVLFYDFYLLKSKNEISSLAYGFFFPLATLVNTLLAIFQIRKDENLVRSADRLR